MFHLYKVERHQTGPYQSALTWLDGSVEPNGSFAAREVVAAENGWDANCCDAEFIGAYESIFIPFSDVDIARAKA